MLPEQLRLLARYPGFPDSARLLIQVIGLEAASRLISAWRGQEWRVPRIIGGGNAAGERRYAALVDVIGETAARRFVRAFGGTRFYIPRLDFARSAIGRQHIRDDYDRLVRSGYSHNDAVFEIVPRYDRSYRAIERILNRPEAAPEAAASNQQALF